YGPPRASARLPIEISANVPTGLGCGVLLEVQPQAFVTRCLRSTTSRPVHVPVANLRRTQHGLRFRTPSEPKAHCGLSEWRRSCLERDVASTRGPLHIANGPP